MSQLLLQERTKLVGKKQVDYFIDGLDELDGVKSVPVRKAPIKEMWDQYLLYGTQSVKRDYSSSSSSSSESNDKVKEKDENTSIPLNTICLSEEELQANNYMVVKSKGRR